MSTGAASVLSWTGTMTAVLAGLTLVGTGVHAQSQAATAADLAALAGADALAAGSGRPCAVAEEAAARNDARLTSCEVRDWDVVVTVEVESAPLPAATEQARAGPSPEHGGSAPTEPR